MNSNRINTLVLLLMFSILPIILVLMFHHITLCETLSCMDSGVFGESSALISFETEDAHIKSFIDISKETGSFAVYSDYEEIENTTVRAIYYNNKYVNLPMKEGRFFKNTDFSSDICTAVIGKDLEKNTFAENSKKYININGIKYEVIGIIGYEDKTLFDKYIFINGNTMNSIFTSKMYTVDIFDCSDSVSFTNELVKHMDAKNQSCELLSETDTFSDKILPAFLYSRLFLVTIFINLICLLLISIQWINKQKKSYCIKRLLGASNFRIFLSLFKKFILVIAISCLSGYTYCLVFYPSYLYSLFLGYSVLIPLVLLFLLFSTFSIFREPLEEALK